MNISDYLKFVKNNNTIWCLMMEHYSYNILIEIFLKFWKLIILQKRILIKFTTIGHLTNFSVIIRDNRICMTFYFFYFFLVFWTTGICHSTKWNWRYHTLQTQGCFVAYSKDIYYSNESHVCENKFVLSSNIWIFVMMLERKCIKMAPKYLLWNIRMKVFSASAWPHLLKSPQ